MLKYYKAQRGEASNCREEITYEEALHTVLGSYKDNDMSRDMLSIPNRIACSFSEIAVESIDENGRVIVSMAGLKNLLPFDREYDESGNRL